MNLVRLSRRKRIDRRVFIRPWQIFSAEPLERRQLFSHALLLNPSSVGSGGVTATIVDSNAQVSQQNQTADFQVTYSSSAGIYPGTIGSSNLELENGFADTYVAEFSSLVSSTDTTATVDYQFSLGGADGSYSVSINPDAAVIDDTGQSASGQIGTINVDNPAKASNYSATTAANTPVTIDLLASNTGVSASQLSIASNPADGSVALDDKSGKATYTPANGFAGSDSFTYTFADSEGRLSTTGTVSIDVTAIAPSITQQPQDQTVTAGSNVTFSVAATGTPLNYQWLFNGNNISGANAATYTVQGASDSAAGSYDVIVSNSAGSVTSNAAQLTVTAAPTAPAITTQPQSQNVVAGSNVTFTVNAGGTAPLSYQWQFDGSNIAGANGSSFTLNGVGSSQAGSYSVVVTNAAGSVTSSAAQLSVSPVTFAPEPALPAQLGDSTFGGGLPVGLDFVAESIAVQTDGKIVVAGHEGDANSPQAVLERLNADGTIDSKFGQGGKVVDPVGSNDAFYSVRIDSNGAILASGSSGPNVLVARYDASGNPDPSLGGSGRITPAVGSGAVGSGVAIDPRNQDIVVSGESDGRFLIERFNPDGSADNAFNGGQPVLFNTGSNTDALGEVAVEGDGSIIAAGETAGKVAIARVLADGTPDTTFGSSGIAGVSIIAGLAAASLGSGTADYTEGLALQNQGGATKILVANHTSDGHFGTARLSPDGSLDATFGTGGIATSNFGGTDDADAVSVTPDGTILVTGTSAAGNGFSLAVAALNAADGSADASFNPAGQLLVPGSLPVVPVAPAVAKGGIGPARVTIIENSIRAVAASQPDGKLIVGFSGQSNSGSFSNVRRINVPAVGAPSVPTPVILTPLGDFGSVSGQKKPQKLTLPGGAVLSLKGGSGKAYQNPSTGQISLTLSGGAVTIKGGISLANVTVAGSLASFSATGADLAGTLFATGIGKLTLGMIGGGTVASASTIGSVTTGSLANGNILAGANLGADGALGGGDDTFAAGAIGPVKITGAIAASTIAAGVAPGTDGIFGTADDQAAGGGSIRSLTARGGADASSHFEAAAFGTAKLPGKVTPSTDSRFRIV